MFSLCATLSPGKASINYILTTGLAENVVPSLYVEFLDHN